MFPLLKSELFRARKRAQTWVTIGIVAAGTMLYFAGFVIAHLAGSDSPTVAATLQVRNADREGLLILAILGGIVGIVVGAGLVGSEYGWNTMRSLVARSGTRTSLLTAKWLAAGIYVLALVVICVLTAYAAATISSLVAGYGFGWSLATIGELARAIALYWIAIAPSVGLAFFAAVITRSNAAAIAIGIAAAFVEPILFGLLGALSDAVDTVQQAGVAFNANRVIQFGADGVNASTFSELAVSALILGIWILGFVAISLRVFERRDVTAG